MTRQTVGRCFLVQINWKRKKIVNETSSVNLALFYDVTTKLSVPYEGDDGHIY